MKPHPTPREIELAHPPLVLRIDETARSLRDKPEWISLGRTGAVLMRTPHQRVVLMALRQGHVLARHRTQGAVLLQVLSGRVRVGADETRVEVGEGCLVTLDVGEPHDVEALAESDVMLTIIKEMDIGDEGHL